MIGQGTVTIMVGDAITRLRELPEDSVHCVITSPPYWALRAYKGDSGMIGLEPTFEEHLKNLVEVFREVRRVLRKDGTFWLNYGDAYNAGTSARRKPSTGNDVGGWLAAGSMGDERVNALGYKPKDLMMMPERLALALQADGWWLRQKMPWVKRNPMPESAQDRPTSAIEFVYLLTKSSRCFYDGAAVRKQPSPDTEARYERGRSDSHKWADGGPGNQTMAKSLDHMVKRPPSGWSSSEHYKGQDVRYKKRKTDKQRGHHRPHVGFNERWDGMSKEEQQIHGRSFRNTDLFLNLFRSLGV